MFLLIHSLQTLTLLKYPPHLSTGDTDLSRASCLLVSMKFSLSQKQVPEHRLLCTLGSKPFAPLSPSFPRAAVTNCHKWCGLSNRMSFWRFFKRRLPCLSVTCVADSPQQGGDPSVGPLPWVANANQATLGWYSRAETLFSDQAWRREGSCSKNTFSPEEREGGNIKG